MQPPHMLPSLSLLDTQDDVQSRFSESGSGSQVGPSTATADHVLSPQVRSHLCSQFLNHQEELDTLATLKSQDRDYGYRIFRAALATLRVSLVLGFTTRHIATGKTNHAGITVCGQDLLAYAMPKLSLGTRKNNMIDITAAQDTLLALERLNEHTRSTTQITVKSRGREKCWNLDQVIDLLRLWTAEGNGLPQFNDLTDPDQLEYCRFSTSSLKLLLKDCKVCCITFPQSS
jgi:hypothetical protein